ncbi:NAD(P)/FAD-dependent oxidoreductase [Thermostichus vulcanus]|uniref:FAD-dependent oxidoreductase n=1 Tax=Thermostichus vulcanus str. 'Rupite' TaxID=2813851 RepID=A0ABT0C855_THEVL|nr:FAD-dependent oxidoreductase [Thermostichus vulcanus]MCJ2541955.1 FAD-dependent oxidoreductase [Thermostichus vulcanus str. 'Rupite']
MGRQRPPRLPPRKMTGSLPTVILAGCGYGAIDALRALKGQARVIAINPYPYIVNSGMSTRLLSGRFSLDLVRIPLLEHIHTNGAEYVQGRVTQIQPEVQTLTVQTELGRRRLAYDYLLVNVGRELRTIAGIHHAFTIRPAEQLLAAQTWIRDCWRRAAQGDPTPGLLTFVVAGGGCTGTELMGELYDLCQEMSATTGIPLTQARWVLINRNRYLATGIAVEKEGQNNRFSRCIETGIRRLGVEIWAECQVKAFGPEQVWLEDGRELLAQTRLWAGGLQVPQWLSECGLPVGPEGSLIVDECLRVKGSERILAMGDCADFAWGSQTRRLPKIGVYAVRQGPIAAQNLLRLIRGQPLIPYRPQATAFVCVTVGNRIAVAKKGWFIWRGYWATVLKNLFDWLYMRNLKPVRWREFFY